MKTTTRLLSLITPVAAGSLALASPPEIRRTEIVRHDIGASGREAIQVRVEFAPGARFPQHTHPGEEIAYVLEGTLEYQLDGSPPITLNVGDAVFIPEGTPHTASNAGTGKAIELATYMVEKGKPLVVLIQ